MKTKVATFPLRLPVSLKTKLQELAERDGTSLNQFLVVAAAEKLTAMYAEQYFSRNNASADDQAFLRILNRSGGVPPSPEDALEEASEPSALR